MPEGEEDFEREKIIAGMSDTMARIKKLQEQVYLSCGDLRENAEFVGKSLHEKMLTNYDEEYSRELEQINALALLDTDKEIEKLKILRAEELDKIKLEGEKLNQELKNKRVQELEQIKIEGEKLEQEFARLRDERKKEFELERKKFEKEFEIQCEKELGELKLEHDRVISEIDRRREKQKVELQILWDTAETEMQIIAQNITPDWRRRFHIGRWKFGRAIPNQAMELAASAADLNSREYLMSRAQQITESQAKYEAKYCGGPEEVQELEEQSSSETEEGVELKPASKSERKRLIKRLNGLTDEQRAEIETQLQELIAAAEDSATSFEPVTMSGKEYQEWYKNLDREERKRMKKEAKRLKKLKKSKRDKDTADLPEEIAGDDAGTSADDVKTDENVEN